MIKHYLGDWAGFFQSFYLFVKYKRQYLFAQYILQAFIFFQRFWFLFIKPESQK